ncbi:hypothetical protein CJU89_4281 [Yarrowia sp. B02]|nr:hypothetical protein CJU89_4281 [Yarrowia sp. B02]
MAETRPSPPSSPTKKPKTNGITVKQENSIVQAPPEEKDPEWSPTRSEVEMALAMHALIQQDPWIEVEVEGRVERMQTVYEIYFGEDNSQNQVRPVLIDGQETDEEKETRAVLVGVYEMCKLIHARNDGLKYDIRTTSQFAIDCYYKHCFKWKINGWTNTNDNPVPNKDVIEATMELLQQLQGRIKFGKLKVVG